MKTKIFFILLIVMAPAFTFAGIPFADQIQPASKNVVLDKKGDKGLKKNVKTKKVKKQNFITKALSDLRGGRSSESATMNILSFIGAMLALVLLFVGGGLISIPLAIASIILGIIGLNRGERLQGLGIAGIAISGSFLFLLLLAILFVITLLRR